MASGEQQRWWAQDDWLAVWIGGTLLAISLAVVISYPAYNTVADQAKPSILSPLRSYIAEPAKWTGNPLVAVSPADQSSLFPGLVGTFLISAVAFGIGTWLKGESVGRFLLAFVPLFLLAALSLIIAAQEDINHWSLEYALWALVIGLFISNTVGLPAFLQPAVRTEFYIKTGLVLMGAGILFGRLLELGPPGLFLSWTVTPIVLITTFWFGQRVLGIESKSLNIVISADMSVCGVSAAIATAAACRAKKEELSLAIGISLAFTVIMMVIQPMVIRTLGINEVVGGAWIGNTIDSTGAVLAAGEMVSNVAGTTAITIKLIQNVLIGFVAFGVALYWVRCVEPNEQGHQPSAWEIWRRFPKFLIGFLAVSALFSLFAIYHPQGNALVEAVRKGGPKLSHGTDTLQKWFFCLAFVSIGLESNFRELGKYLRGGKPVALYICGQTFSLFLSLFMAWLMFQVVFPQVTERLLSK
jgi:uncharacterized membrane protein YadS